MLGKLIKYEFKATARRMLPLIVAVLVLSLLSSFSVMRLDSATDYGVIQVFFILIIVAFVVGIIALGVMSIVVFIDRFYKNLLGSEGYLMFTLPVSVDALVWSKLIVSFIWLVLTSLAVLAAMLILGFVTSALTITGEEIRMFMDGVKLLFAQIGAGNIIGYVLEFVVLMFVSSLATCLHFYLAMAIGQAFANRKMLWSVVFYFVLSFALSMLSAAAVALGDKIGILDAFVDLAKTATQSAHLMAVSSIIVYTVVSAILYFPTTALLKKKLNLA